MVRDKKRLNWDQKERINRAEPSAPDDDLVDDQLALFPFPLPASVVWEGTGENLQS